MHRSIARSRSPLLDLAITASRSPSHPPLLSFLLRSLVSPLSSSTESADAAAVLPSSSSSNTSKVDFIPTLLQPRVVVYDGLCRLCHRYVKWVINADKYQKIKFCCVQSKAADPYLIYSGLDHEDVRRQFLFVDGPDAYYQGSTAALKVISYLPFPYQALSLLLIVPTPVRDMVYGQDARRHYDHYKEEEDCIVMRDKEILDRFIDRDEILAKENAKAREL